MAMGCWSEQELVGEQGHWQAKKLNADASQWEVWLDGEKAGEVKWDLVGEHNMHNGLMAIAAARHVGVLPADAANALGGFINARRRLELRGEANGVTVYDDFAHHPTAILATLQALRGKVGGTARILAVLEPRSNTMKMGCAKTIWRRPWAVPTKCSCCSRSTFRGRLLKWRTPACSLRTGVPMSMSRPIWWSKPHTRAIISW